MGHISFEKFQIPRRSVLDSFYFSDVLKQCSYIKCLYMYSNYTLINDIIIYVYTYNNMYINDTMQCLYYITVFLLTKMAEKITQKYRI